MLARWYGLGAGTLRSRAYLIAGLGLRHVGRVRTGNEFSYADGTTDYNEAPASPVSQNQAGAVVGAGMRFIDDFNIKVTPEFRYVRWHAAGFSGQSYRSAPGELRFGLGISF